MMEDYFPINVHFYSKKESMIYAHLFRAYVHAHQFNIGQMGKDVILKKLKTYNTEDYSSLKHFFNQYQKIFGKPDSQNQYYKQFVVWVMMSIYYNNIKVIDEKLLWERISKKLYLDKNILEMGRYQSCDFANDTRKNIITKLNKGWKQTKFI